MALAQNPSIAALSNLVLYYDAANVKSYPGAGTTINDMSGNGNNGTLTNGPIWGAANNGVISFDGTDDYLSIGSQSLVGSGTTTFTAEISFYNTKSWSAGQYTMFFRIKQDTEFFFVLYNYLSTLYALPAFRNYHQWGYPLTTTISDYVNKWFTMTIVYNGGSKGNASSFNLYINGSLLPAGTYDFGTAGGVSSNCNIIGADGNSGCNVTTAYHQGFISNYKIYNTALTAAQVLQNYNASRGRYVGTLPFSPTDISGLSAWFDADDPRTLFSDTSGTTRATTDGNSVALWVDKSGNGRNASQSTANKCPLLKTSVINNRNVIRGDGSNDTLSLSRAVADDFSIFVLFQTTQSYFRNSSTQWYEGAGLFDSEVGNVVNDYGLSMYQGYPRAGTGNPDTSITDPTTRNNGSPNLVCFTRLKSTGALNLYSNGIPVASGTGTTASLTSPTVNYLMSTADSYGYMNGDVAEVLVYNSVLSAANRIKVEQYLQNKWGVNTSFLPTQISGLTLWLDANDSGSLYQVSNGTNPALNNNDFIGLWKDKSGNSNNATQSTASLRPYVVASGQNSKNIIRFPYAAWNAATGPYMNATIGSLSAYSVFIICKFRTNEYYSMVLTGGSSQFEVRNYSSTGYIEWNIAGGYFPRDTVSNVGSYILIELTRSGSDYTLYKNGISVGTSNNASSLNIGSTIFISSRSGNSYYFDGDMAEIIIYNSAITTAQRQQVEAYLNQKWGVF